MIPTIMLMTMTISLTFGSSMLIYQILYINQPIKCVKFVSQSYEQPLVKQKLKSNQSNKYQFEIKMDKKSNIFCILSHQSPSKLFNYNQTILPSVDRLSPFKKHFEIVQNIQDQYVQIVNPQKHHSDNNIAKNISQKFSNQISRIKSLGEHHRSKSHILKYQKPKYKINQEKQKVEKIKQCCIPTVAFSKEDSETVDSEIQQNQQQCNDKLATYTTSKNIYMLKSVYAGRQPTIFFYYCQQTYQLKQTNERIYLFSQKQKQKIKFLYKFPSYNPFKCVVNPLKYGGLAETDDSDWLVYWGMPKRNIVRKLNKFQKINHFPGCWELGRKDNLWKNLWAVKKKFKQQYSFVPNTYILPYDLQKFQRRKQEVNKKHLWIMKPVASACGRGVKMVSKKSKIHKKHNYLVCQYIANPFLINDLKFDLRIYVLVSSYDPLRIYLFEEGLTRFATEKYSTNISQLTKKYIHLTNYSVNKYAPKFQKNTNIQQDGQGSKWSLTALKKYLLENNWDLRKLQSEIEDIIIKTCIAAEPHMLDITSKTTQHRNNCFQIYGFDILIDDALKPWLIEVNVCPSLSSTSPLDLKIKHTLLTDTFNLIGIQPVHFVKQSPETKPKNIFARNLRTLSDLNHTNCVQKLCAQDWNVLFETDEQNHRRGHFKRIFPNKENVNYYQKFFQFERYNNIMVARWLQDSENFLNKISEKRYFDNI